MSTTGTVAGWFDNCPDLQGDQVAALGEQTMYWLAMREHLRAAGASKADQVIGIWDSAWQPVAADAGRHWMQYAGGTKPTPTGAAKDFIEFFAQITADRLPNQQAVDHCRMDWQLFACLAAAIASAMAAGDTAGAAAIGNQFKTQGAVPLNDTVLADPAYRNLAYGVDCPTGQTFLLSQLQCIPNTGIAPTNGSCPEGTTLSSGTCLPTQPVVADEEKKAGWPTWLWVAIGLGSVAAVGAIAAFAKSNPTSESGEAKYDVIVSERGEARYYPLGVSLKQAHAYCEKPTRRGASVWIVDSATGRVKTKWAPTSVWQKRHAAGLAASRENPVPGDHPIWWTDMLLVVAIPSSPELRKQKPIARKTGLLWPHWLHQGDTMDDVALEQSRRIGPGWRIWLFDSGKGISAPTYVTETYGGQPSVVSRGVTNLPDRLRDIPRLAWSKIKGPTLQRHPE
jgi:hypothetical protein